MPVTGTKYAPLSMSARSWAALGIAIGTFTIVLLNLVIRFGQHIPQTNLGWDYTVGVAWAMLIGVLIRMAPIDARTRNALFVLWLARCAITLGAMLPYEGAYSFLDGYTYYSASRANGFDPGQLGFQSGTNNILQMAAFHHLVLPDSYHALKVSFALAGLLAVYAFYVAATLLIGRRDIRILYLVGLFPSIIFWSSILGKDPVILLGTALYVLGVVGWTLHHRKRYVILFVSGILLAGFIRIWSVPILLVPAVVPIVASVHGVRNRIILLLAAAALSVLAVGVVSEYFLIASTADLLTATELWSQAWAIGGSARTIDVDLTSISSVLAFLPFGAFAALFRPLPGEVMNPFGLLAGAENLVLLCMVFYAAACFRMKDFTHPLALWALLLIILWSAVYGLVSYQNLGTAARFKLQILPVLLGFIGYGLRSRLFPREQT